MFRELFVNVTILITFLNIRFLLLNYADENQSTLKSKLVSGIYYGIFGITLMFFKEPITIGLSIDLSNIGVDTYGHQSGDIVLKELAQVLMENFEAPVQSPVTAAKNFRSFYRIVRHPKHFRSPNASGLQWKPMNSKYPVDERVGLHYRLE